MLSFLTPAEQIEYAKARAKALADNPDLKAEGESVARQGAQAMSSDATPADKQTFLAQMSAHRQKLREAMLKEDATLEPVFRKIDEHLAEMKAQQQNSSNPGGGSPAGPAGQ